MDIDLMTENWGHTTPYIRGTTPPEPMESLQSESVAFPNVVISRCCLASIQLAIALTS